MKKKSALLLFALATMLLISACATELATKRVSDRFSTPLQRYTHTESPAPMGQQASTPESQKGVDLKTTTFEECMHFFSNLYGNQGIFMIQPGFVDIFFDEKATWTTAKAQAASWGREPKAHNPLPLLEKASTDEDVFSTFHIIRIRVSEGEEFATACHAVKEPLITTASPAASSINQKT